MHCIQPAEAPYVTYEACVRIARAYLQASRWIARGMARGAVGMQPHGSRDLDRAKSRDGTLDELEVRACVVWLMGGRAGRQGARATTVGRTCSVADNARDKTAVRTRTS